jgi:hypothetical protein
MQSAKRGQNAFYVLFCRLGVRGFRGKGRDWLFERSDFLVCRGLDGNSFIP